MSESYRIEHSLAPALYDCDRVQVVDGEWNLTFSEVVNACGQQLNTLQVSSITIDGEQEVIVSLWVDEDNLKHNALSEVIKDHGAKHVLAEFFITCAYDGGCSADTAPVWLHPYFAVHVTLPLAILSSAECLFFHLLSFLQIIWQTKLLSAFALQTPRTSQAL